MANGWLHLLDTVPSLFAPLFLYCFLHPAYPQVYGFIATMIIIILPWTIFYYESYDVDNFGDEVR